MVIKTMREGVDIKVTDVENMAKAAVEQLSEDESLRGDLTDEGFDPLMQWLVDMVTIYARKLGGGNTDTATNAMNDYTARLKEVAQAVVAAAESGQIDDPQELLGFDKLEATQLRHKLTNLQLTKDAADANAVKIVAVLAAATGTKPEHDLPAEK